MDTQNNKIKIITLDNLIVETYLKCIDIEYTLTLLVYMLLSSVINPYLLKIAYGNFVGKQLNNGLNYIVAWLIGRIALDIYNSYLLFPLKCKFDGNTKTAIEIILNNEISKLTNIKSRELNNDKNFDNAYIEAFWQTFSYVNQINDTFITTSSFVGCVFWICYISPLSMLSYVVTGYVLMKYLKRDESDNYSENRKNIYEKFWYYYNNRHINKIHCKEDISVNGMLENTHLLNLDKFDKMKKDNEYSDKIKIAFNITFLFNCLIVGANINIIDIIIYIQYCTNFHNSIASFFDLKNRYNVIKRDYEKFEKIMNECDTKQIVEQFDNYDSIIINNIDYTYPKKNDDDVPFRLSWKTSIEFKKGYIINVVGNSGNGKSTFLDILSGLIPQTDYTHNISIGLDGKFTKINGFEHLMETRYYNEQFETLSNGSIATNIIGDLDNNDDDLLLRVLEMCNCIEFVTIDNSDKSKKWIHDTKVKMSGGEQGRIKLARTMMNIIKNKPKFVILDEIDKAIQPELMVKVMTEIYNYAKINGIIVFVVGHHTEIKNMSYDAVLEFNKGEVNLVKMK